MKNKQEIGTEGEDIAVAMLQKKGYKILARNFRALNSEIDIICKKESLLVFVEVRLKHNADYGFPEETMNKGKKNAIKRGAEAYILQNPWEGDVRFDFISILRSPEFEIIHFEDAFC